MEPENTLRGFRKALEHGANQLEMDIRMTKDGVPVIMHDSTVTRTTNGRGSVSKLYYNDIRLLDAGKGENVPSLVEVLQEFGNRVFLHLHIKWRVSPIKTVKLIEQYGLERRVCISSFSHKILRVVKKMNPHIMTAVLYVKPSGRILRILDKLGAGALHVHKDYCTKHLIDSVHSCGRTVRVWGIIDERDRCEKCISWKVDGIILDGVDVPYDLLQ